MRNLMAALVVAVLWGGLAFAEEPKKPTQSANPESCVVSRTIKGWSYVDPTTITLRGGGKRYKVTFHGTCREANWGFTVRVESFGMCLRVGDVLVFGSSPHMSGRGGFQERCFIKSIELVPPKP